MLHYLPLGSYQTNCYILKDDATGEALVVDCPVFEPPLETVLERVGVSSLRYILLTHGHFDHVCGVKALKAAYGGQVCIHSLDAPCLTDPEQSLSTRCWEVPQEPVQPEILLSDGMVLPFGESGVRVMHTPGHTRGSVCFFYNDIIFSGDTLFYLSMGRTDLPGGSTKQLFASLRAIGQIPGEYRIFPGHGEPTDLTFEKRFNRYLRAK